MASLAHVGRDDVLRAIALADQLGDDAFLSRFGYGRATRYALRYRGRSFPYPKAIVGVAAGLSSRELQGGRAQVLPLLTRLGFEVREGKRRAIDPRIVAAAIAATFDRSAPTAPRFDGADPTYFASGSNRRGEILGLGDIGHDVGVAADELDADAIAALEELRGTDVQVFVDSGAFSEVAFSPELGRFVIVRPIEDAEWLRRLGLYRRLARALGDQVWVVAPDRVGDQAETLSRLVRYRDQVREIAELGARILVPVQKGELSQAAFYRAAVDALGSDLDLTPALPCKKAATSSDEARAFVSEIRPHHIHLLGLGIYGNAARRSTAYIEGIAKDSPRTSISTDSCWIRSAVGNDKPGGRLYTAARRAAKAALGILDAGRKRLSTTNAALVAELALILSFGLKAAGLL